MTHIHLDSCKSTQILALEKLKEQDFNELIISCERQTAGIGQRHKTWDSYHNSLCFSFTIKENEVLNLTSLEMGVLICSYFNEYFNHNLQLKWPNDILNQNGKKVGGIIINKFGDLKPIIGMGLNLFAHNGENLNHYDIRAGFIFNHSILLNKKEMVLKIYQYIKDNRLNQYQTIKQWNQLCSHLNKEVIIIEDNKRTKGIFKGIGQYGQGKLAINNELKEIYTGSLRIND